jgi:outer membrane lipoprotein SlyB
MYGFWQRLLIVAVCSSGLLAGCQSTPRQRVVVDPTGIDQAAFDKDLAECTTLADDAGRNISTGPRVTGGLMIGGTMGGLGGGSRGAVTMGTSGALLGGSSAADQRRAATDQILKNCMRGRGYRVLN